MKNAGGQDPKPRIVVSACLGFEACRWNGATVPDELVASLKPFVEFIPVCPEVAIGLGIPRDPIKIVSSGDALRLVQPATGRDLTDDMSRFAGAFLEKTGRIDAVILKARSPSCALHDADRFESTDSDASAGKGPGMFTAKLREKLRGVPIEDEHRLMDKKNRLKFLARLPISIDEVKKP